MNIINIPFKGITNQGGVKFEYDPAKSAANRDKHGIDFEEAKELWRGSYLKAPAKRKGERRYAVVGLIDGVCWTAIATDRGERIRIVSVRRSTEKERNCYERRKDNP